MTLLQHLTIIGAGSVGLKVAQALRRFRSRLAVIDRPDRIVKREDGDFLGLLQDLLQAADAVSEIYART